MRAGTPIAEVEAATAEAGQMLPFEPPRFGGGTIGGCAATGLSGPRRPYGGAVRDLILGVRIVNGAGEDLRFGGRVIKNVAGYDVSRLMVGAMGTLGVLLEISFKVVPRPAAETTLRFEITEANAIETMNRWAGRPLPISATSYRAGALTVRLSGRKRPCGPRATHLAERSSQMARATGPQSGIRPTASLQPRHPLEDIAAGNDAAARRDAAAAHRMGRCLALDRRRNGGETAPRQGCRPRRACHPLSRRR